MATPFTASRRWLNSQAVRARYGWSMTTLWQHVHDGNFPAPVKLTPGRNYWAEDVLVAWERERIGTVEQAAV